MIKLDAATRECHPVSHVSGHVPSTHELSALPLEREIGVENLALPIRHVSELIHQGYYGPLSDSPAIIPIAGSALFHFMHSIEALCGVIVIETYTPSEASSTEASNGVSAAASNASVPGEGIGQFTGSSKPGNHPSYCLNAAIDVCNVTGLFKCVDGLASSVSHRRRPWILTVSRVDQSYTRGSKRILPSKFT